MAKEIVWSPRADKTFDSIIDYLRKEWTEKEIIRFVKKTYTVLSLLEKGNIAFRHSKKKGIHEILITRQNLLIYKETRKSILLVTFYDTRQHPKKKTFRTK